MIVQLWLIERWKMNKNTLIVNGQETEVSPEYMRDFYESTCDSLTLALFNKNKFLKEKLLELKEAKKEIEELKAKIERT